MSKQSNGATIVNTMGNTALGARQRLLRQLRNAGIADEAVLNTLFNTPRHLFVDEALSGRAYENTALPIGFGQTISQPYIVARMTETLLAGTRLAKVLEIGTGSAYQTAVLAQLVDSVYSVERISKLLERARLRLRSLGLSNVRLKYEDGNLGWPRYAPYDGIMITAACAEVPTTLLEQLAPSGRLVAPVGGQHNQELILVQRDGDEFTRQSLGAVVFVPLLGGVL